MCALHVSQTNDVFDGERFVTNFSGGISGGISNSAEVVVRVAVRPATSIGKPQTAARAEGGTTTIGIKGRTDSLRARSWRSDPPLRFDAESIERLRDPPAGIADLVAGVPAAILTRRDGAHWS